MREDILVFLKSPAFAVMGASTNRNKFGNKVLRCYLQNKMKVYPINPRADVIEGIACLHKIADLPDNVKSISIITPPKITEQILDEVIQKKIGNVWMQPGAESELAIEKCLEHNINVIAGGPCILVELGFKDE